MPLALLSSFDIDRVIAARPFWHQFQSPTDRLFGYQWHVTYSDPPAQGVLRAGLWDFNGDVVDSQDVLLGATINYSINVAEFDYTASCNVSATRAAAVVRASELGEDSRLYVMLADQESVRAAALDDWDWLWDGSMPPTMYPALPFLTGFNTQAEFQVFRIDDDTFGVAMLGQFFNSTGAPGGGYQYYQWPFWRAYNWDDLTPASGFIRADLLGETWVNETSDTPYLWDSMCSGGSVRFVLRNSDYDAIIMVVADMATGVAISTIVHTDIQEGLGVDTYLNDAFFLKGDNRVGVYYFDEAADEGGGDEFLKVYIISSATTLPPVQQWYESGYQIYNSIMGNELAAQAAVVGTDGYNMRVVEDSPATLNDDLTVASVFGDAWAVFGPDNVVRVANTSNMSVALFTYTPLAVTVATATVGGSTVRWWGGR